MDFDEVADELYALGLQDFTATRAAQARQARAGGDRELAARIAGLGKPTVAAWLANRLARARPDEVAALVELGDRMRAATTAGDGVALRELAPAQRQLVAALAGRAEELARAAGRAVSDGVARELEETFRAALADRDAGERLAAGRLTASLSPAGFVGAAAVAPRPPAPPVQAQRPAEDEARAALAAAEQRLARAQRAAEARAGEAADAAAAVDELAARLADARTAKTRAETARRRADADAAAARRERDEAERRLAAASATAAG